MKKIFLLSLVLMNSLLYAQTWTSSCTPTPQMITLYQNDVYKLTTYRLLATNSPYKDSIEIPAVYRDSIAKVLYAIHNMQPSTIKDTILNLFGFSDFGTTYAPSYEVDSLHFMGIYPVVGSKSVKAVEMYISDTTTWGIQWAAGNYNNTSEPQINQLVNNYQLTITLGSHFFGRYNFIARALTGLNTNGLSARFNAIINSPTACEPARYIGDGNSINMAYETDGIKITYRNGCGDCPSGCTHGRTWAFKVYYATCNVEYLGAANFGYDPSTTQYGWSCTRGPVLPVFFSSVSGSLQGGMYSSVSWRVLTQVNVKEYVIEKSGDGRQFFAVGTVPATTALNAAYNWKEATALNGTAWYRIKAVDLDGKMQYSSIVKMTNAKGASFTIFPNPVTNHSFTVQFATPVSGTLQAVLYSASGKQVWASSLGLVPQTLSCNISLPAYLSSGIYTLLLEQNGTPYRQLLMIASE